MSNITRLLKTIATIFALAASPLTAAEFVLTTWGDWEGQELFSKTGSDYIAIDLADLSLSQTMAYEKADGLILYRKIEKEEETVYEPAVKVSVPSDIVKPLVMLFSDNGKIEYRVMEMSPANYPGSSIRFVNLSPRTLVVTFGDKAHMLKAGSEYLLRQRIRENKVMQITASIVTGESTYQKMYSTMIMNRPQKRMVMFFHAKNAEELECRSLVDFVREGNQP